MPLEAYRPEQCLLLLREHFDLRVSVRRVLAPDRRPITIVRNLLGGASGGAATRDESDGLGPASDEITLTQEQIEELAELACDLVEQDPESILLSVDKANLLATSRLWRRVASDVTARRGIAIHHLYVDRCAFEIGHDDSGGSVILTEGIFGDILSDLAASRAGSIALCGSASVNPGHPARGRCVGLFEPVHGSAPKHAGARRANPTGAFLATAALLEWFVDTEPWGRLLREALDEVLRARPFTYDMAPPGVRAASTDTFSGAVVSRFADRLVTS